MRGTLRFLASVSSRPSNHLIPNAPTGLTGLRTHPFPRPALLYIYSTTLQKLAQLPETSVYRQSTEALTRSRLKVIESIEPPGFDEWQRRVEDYFVPLMEKEPIMAKEMVRRLQVKGKPYLFQEFQRGRELDEREREWDGDPAASGESLATNEGEERVIQRSEQRREFMSGQEIENEPPLTTDQVSEIEQKIGAGLIEEIIKVAEGEDRLVDVMLRNKVWEELEEKPAEGQWKYFERTT